MKDTTAVPDGLSGRSSDLWRTGTGEFNVRAGDLWTLAWDGQLLGHVMVASLKAGFFLGWPVTLPGEPSFTPGMLSESPLGVDVTIWPTRETGLGLHLLERPLGQLMEAGAIRRIAACLDEGDDPGVRLPTGKVDSAEREAISAVMTGRWAELCFHTGRLNDDAVFLDQAKIRDLGGNAREIGYLLSLKPAEVRTYWDAEQELPAPMEKVLLSHYGVEADRITRQNPALWWWDLLALPSYKAGVEITCGERQETEMVIRAEVAQSAYALAARQDSDMLADQKLRDAIRRAATLGRK